MSFRYGAKSVMRNPKPCSIKTTTLIKPYIWALIEKTLQVLLMGVGGGSMENALMFLSKALHKCFLKTNNNLRSGLCKNNKQQKRKAKNQ